MRTGTDTLWQVLSGSFDCTFEADLYYGDTRLFEGLPILTPQITWDGTADVEASGTVEVSWTDAQGSSLSPVDPQDWLAPFGSRLVIFSRVTAGPVSERTQLGVFTVTAVPDASDESILFGNVRVTVGSRVSLQFKDRMVEVQRDKFTQLSQPTHLESVYAELADLTGFQLTRTIADGAVTRSVVYQEDRIKAIQDVADILNGIPFMESDGTLSLRDKTPGAVVAALTIGEDGTLTEIGSKLDSSSVYNGVIIRGETTDQAPILTELWVESGPLRRTPPGGARTPYHRVPRFYTSPFITTQAQAIAAAPALLEQFSQPRAMQLSVSCVVNPLLQIGDVVTVRDDRAVWTIRLLTIKLGGPVMQVLGDVLDRVPYAPGDGEDILELLGYGEGTYGDGGYGY